MESLHTQGISLPRPGLGTYRMQGDVCRAAVESGLALGYRHLDTAEMYGNEEAIGAAIATAGVKRNELHVTTKVWNENLAPDAMRRAFDTSLKKLRLDVVDLYLVHWPKPGMHLPSMFETLITSGQLAESTDGAWAQGQHFSTTGLQADSNDAQRAAFAMQAVRGMEIGKLTAAIAQEDNVIWVRFGHG